MDEFVFRSAEFLENRGKFGGEIKNCENNDEFFESLQRKLTENPNYFLAWDQELSEILDTKSILNKWTVGNFRDNISAIPFSDASFKDVKRFSELQCHEFFLMYFVEAYLTLKFHPQNCSKKIANLAGRSYRGLDKHYIGHPSRQEYVEGVNYLWRWFMIHTQLVQKRFTNYSPPPPEEKREDDYLEVLKTFMKLSSETPPEVNLSECLTQLHNSDNSDLEKWGGGGEDFEKFHGNLNGGETNSSYCAYLDKNLSATEPIANCWDLSKLDGMLEYEELRSGRSKAIVKVLKWMIVSNFFKLSQNEKCHQLSIDLMREIAYTDPKTYNWHYLFQNNLRFFRRTHKNSGPFVPDISEEEIQTLWETYAHCEYPEKHPDEPNAESKESSYKRMAYAGLLQGLAEFLKAKTRVPGQEANTSSPIKFADLEFVSLKELGEFVNSGVCSYLKGQCTFAELIRAGEILSGILPQKYRDYDLAEICFKRALRICPDNSKSNHKLGSFYISHHPNKLLGICKGLPFLYNAIETAPQNFPALKELLRTLLFAPDRTAQEFKDLVTKYEKTEFSSMTSDSVKADLKLCEGYLKFMNNDHSAAVQTWIEAYQLNSAVSFVELKQAMRKYWWPEHLISPWGIKRALEWYGKNHPQSQPITELLAKTVPSSGFIGRENHPGGSSPEFRRNNANNNQQFGPSSSGSVEGAGTGFECFGNFRTRFPNSSNGNSNSNSNNFGNRGWQQRRENVSESEADDNWRRRKNKISQKLDLK